MNENAPASILGVQQRIINMFICQGVEYKKPFRVSFELNSNSEVKRRSDLVRLLNVLKWCTR